MKYKLKRLKRKFRYNKKRSTFFLFLFLLVCSVGLGYAALSTTLSIDGSAQFKDARWNVYFDNLNVTSGSVTATTAASITNTTTVSFAARLENPGDFYEFTVDVVNGGNMNAMIESFNILPELTTAQQNYLSYKVTYRNGVELALYQKLDAGDTETLKVRFEYLENNDVSLYPTEDDSVTIAFDVTYVQADENAVEVDHSINGIIYSINTYNVYATEPKWNSVWINQPYPETIPYFETPAGVLSAFASAAGKDKLFYLKHNVVNGIVTDSYVEFIVPEAIAQENVGMVAGTYTLRAAVTYDKDTSTWLVDEDYINPYFESNMEILKTAFGYQIDPSRCNEHGGTGRGWSFFCGVFGLYADADASGYVNANDADGAGCSVYLGGYSNCYWE